MIKIICVGKIKEKFFSDAILEYLKRLSKYTKVNIIELSDVALDNKDLILQKEKESILKHINTKDYVVTLEIEGKNITSEQLAELIDKTHIYNPVMTFIIGGSYGLHDDVKNRSDFKLSFSKMTFPHQLFRVLLLEQIYRAYKINNKESYHK